jgi:CTP synthase (UTP-ammonia lyase)
MDRPLRVGIIGDFDPTKRSHIPTTEALNHAAHALSVALDCSWIPTQILDNESSEAILKGFDALWCAPGSPYKSMNGALRAIRFARERGWPFLGT